MRTFRWTIVLLAALLACQDAALRDYNLGIDAFEEGDTAAAVEYFERSIARRANDPDAHFNLGTAYYTVGNYERALRQFRIVAEYTPTDPQLHHNLAETYLALGRPQAAKTEYEYAIRLDSELVEAHSGLGKLLYETGQYEEARDRLSEAISTRPGYAPAQFHMGYVYIELGKVNEATQFFLRGLRADTRSSYGRLGLARTYELRDKFDLALPEYEKVHGRHAKNGDAMVGMGRCFVALARIPQAMRILEKAIQADPENAEAFRVLGDAYLAQQQHTEAAANYRMAIQLREDFPAAHIGLGRALEAGGLTKDAETAFQRAVYHDPENAEALYRLGQVYAELNDTGRAISYLELALERSKDDPNFMIRVRELLKLLRDKQ